MTKIMTEKLIKKLLAVGTVGILYGIVEGTYLNAQQESEDPFKKLEEDKLIVQQLKSALEGLEERINKLSELERDILSIYSVIGGIDAAIKSYNAKLEKFNKKIEEMKNKQQELNEIYHKYSSSDLGKAAYKEITKIDSLIKMIQQDSIGLYNNKIDSLRKVRVEYLNEGKKLMNQFKDLQKVVEEDMGFLRKLYEDYKRYNVRKYK